MWYWFGLAALALIGELSSGTFYLLLVALGLVGGGLAAWGGLELPWQILASAVVALVGLFILRRTGVLKKREVDANGNADVNLDIGQVVEVQSWSAEGLARVWYRGAHWQAQLAEGAPRQAGTHRISAVRGSVLILAPRNDAPVAH
ncbi:NfeD-like family protein 1 [Bordetella genomosp. 1]|uniref:NfeD-like family protein 1 n=1 Tax=Bordetella genomosp. 1 TaxID=1395607 RepID=A0A261SCR9_9BORD|nr:NfeD family protein [Bordetella genomosp. 1]MDQ8031673.1 NfeD family protein [Bordetella sp.]OZI35184.1 NfeD-like family protein 1 [Bordetella genomosp. 1]OZI63726.1 NfeD-like family protein 1 [Bordetella genomosp. 1]